MLYLEEDKPAEGPKDEDSEAWSSICVPAVFWTASLRGSSVSLICFFVLKTSKRTYNSVPRHSEWSVSTLLVKSSDHKCASHQSALILHAFQEIWKYYLFPSLQMSWLEENLSNTHIKHHSLEEKDWLSLRHSAFIQCIWDLRTLPATSGSIHTEHIRSSAFTVFIDVTLGIHHALNDAMPRPHLNVALEVMLNVMLYFTLMFFTHIFMKVHVCKIYAHFKRLLMDQFHYIHNKLPLSCDNKPTKTCSGQKNCFSEARHHQMNMNDSSIWTFWYTKFIVHLPMSSWIWVTTRRICYIIIKSYIDMAFSGSKHAGKHLPFLRRKIKDNSAHHLWKTAVVDLIRDCRVNIGVMIKWH